MDRFKIEEKIGEFKTTFLPQEFEWRRGQKESIVEIVEAYFGQVYDTVILDAPVGSGKSLVAMCSAWTLNQSNAEGYILASDIALQEQYEKDFHKFKLKWGSIKGVDNYICVDNMEKNSMGTCRIRNTPAKQMSCYNECPYFGARDHASITSTSLLNYAYWLIHMNYVNKIMDESQQIFSPRDFIFCDEAHKLLDIIQNNYSPKIDEKTLEKIEKLTHFFDTYKVKDHRINFITIKRVLKEIGDEENQETLLSLLDELSEEISNYIESVGKFKDKVKKDTPKGKPNREWREALYNSDWILDFHHKITDYISIIKNTSSRNLIKNPQMDNSIIFNCLEESYLMQKYFHRWTGFKVLMSATFSDPVDYLKGIAVKKAKYIKLESSFDFTKSPIYFYNKRRMSFNKIQEHLPWLITTVDNIISEKIGGKGIIHSASYDLSLKIFKGLSVESRKRVLIYGDTEEKRKLLEVFKISQDKIIMGPSLLEGLDLAGDLSRFQIFLKVPYLHLGDKFVKAKLAIDPAWYRQKSALAIIQGVGRSIRHEGDFADTYILDACLGDLIHANKRAFPKEFMQRLRIISE